MNKIICNNPTCGAENLSNAKYCRKCGILLYNKTDNSKTKEDEFLPFLLRHPEYNLVPYSVVNFSWFFNKPDYVERPDTSIIGELQYLWIVRDGKMGITNYVIWKNGYVQTSRIIKYKYDKIEKGNGYFKCYEGSKVVYFDLKGNILK